MSSILNLIIYILILVFLVSAASGVLMFFIDMFRFGTPRKRFEVVSSIEKYNERMEKKENEFVSETSPDQSESISENVDIFGEVIKNGRNNSALL